MKYIDIDTDATFWNNETWEDERNQIAIIQRGCDCCQEKHRPTPEILAEAIADAEDYVKELKELRDKLYAPPTNT